MRYCIEDKQRLSRGTLAAGLQTLVNVACGSRIVFEGLRPEDLAASCNEVSQGIQCNPDNAVDDGSPICREQLFNAMALISLLKSDNSVLANKLKGPLSRGLTSNLLELMAMPGVLATFYTVNRDKANQDSKIASYLTSPEVRTVLRTYLKPSQMEEVINLCSAPLNPWTMDIYNKFARRVIFLLEMQALLCSHYESIASFVRDIHELEFRAGREGALAALQCHLLKAQQITVEVLPKLLKIVTGKDMTVAPLGDCPWSLEVDPTTFADKNWNLKIILPNGRSV